MYDLLLIGIVVLSFLGVGIFFGLLMFLRG